MSDAEAMLGAMLWDNQNITEQTRRAVATMAPGVYRDIGDAILYLHDDHGQLAEPINVTQRLLDTSGNVAFLLAGGIELVASLLDLADDWRPEPPEMEAA